MGIKKEPPQTGRLNRKDVMIAKPIETIYNGYRFRSRLEARWAVFFDAAGIMYEYEPEGFELEDGTRYLPDFYFPAYGWYAEVKAPRDGASEEIEKASRFVGKGIDALILLGNIPSGAETPVYHYTALYYHPLRKEVEAEKVCFSPTGAADQEPWVLFGITSWQGIDRLSYRPLHYVLNHIEEYLTAVSDKDLFQSMCGGDNYYWGKDVLDDESIEILSSHYQAAKQARFEHGETP